MKTLHAPTPDQRVAFHMLNRMYQRDLAHRADGLGLPGSHANLCTALRGLDLLVFGDEADDLAPGELTRRWEWHCGAEAGPLPRDRSAGAEIADRLLYAAAARTPLPLTDPQVFHRVLIELFGPIEGLGIVGFADVAPDADEGEQG